MRRRSDMPPADVLDRDVEISTRGRDAGYYVRVQHKDYDSKWVGPFETQREALTFVEKTWRPVKTGFKMTNDLEGVRTRPAWIRRS